MLSNALPECWQTALGDEFRSTYFRDLQQFLEQERREHTVFPPAEDVLNALRLTPLTHVRALILGQDPYHDDNQAHGLSFSVRPGVAVPRSLKNIYKELKDDLNIDPPAHGCLNAWAMQGVLLLNTVLTVRAHKANSHRNKGWELFTNRILECVNQQPHVAFVLWGNQAQQKASLIDSRHLLLTSAHPSPLSARRGFFGSRPFSKINAYLQQHNLAPINWNMTSE